jgi:Cu(I)-responsive transcriptional regulator
MLTKKDAGLDRLPGSVTIGDAARLAGVSVETIRFYEREGLIVQPGRQEGHFRRYPSDTVVRLQFIRRAKDLGFSLEEIRELLQLGEDPETACADVRARAEEKIRAIDEKLTGLTLMREALLRLTAACRDAPTGRCPILEALSGERWTT